MHKADELAESYVNGNISTVADELEGKPRLALETLESIREINPQKVIRFIHTMSTRLSK